MLDVSRSTCVTASPNATVAAANRALGFTLPETLYASLRGRRLAGRRLAGRMRFCEQQHACARSRAAAPEQLGGGNAAEGPRTAGSGLATPPAVEVSPPLPASPPLVSATALASCPPLTDQLAALGRRKAGCEPDGGCALHAISHQGFLNPPRTRSTGR